ncbi:hypothetical protein ACFIOZ_12760 [Vreelandella sp. F11]|uniref:hypothetical protein n=1 Tax=Vreelandella sp. F11 TaxID=3394751 RepID=UPI0036D9AF3B
MLLFSVLASQVFENSPDKLSLRLPLISPHLFSVDAPQPILVPNWDAHRIADDLFSRVFVILASERIDAINVLLFF